jgi:hypothetical protein
MVLFVVIVIFLLNDILGFSFHHNINQQINEIAKINEIIKEGISTSEETDQLLSLKRAVLARRSFSDQFFLFITGANNQSQQKTVYATNNNRDLKTNLIDSLATTRQNVMANGVANTNNTINPALIRNNYWFLISCSWIYLLLLLILPLFHIVMKGRDGGESWSFCTDLLIGVIICFLILINYSLFNLIPLIGSSWLWNYAVNTIASSVPIILFFYFANKHINSQR